MTKTANILITGANRGIGLELVRQYSEAGHTVYAACRAPTQANGLKGMDNVHPIEVSVGDDQSVAAMAKQLEGVTIDILINNAGTGGPARDKQTAFDMDFDGWADAMNINAIAPVRVMQALMPNLRASDGAKVVNITSQLGSLDLDFPMGYAYCSSKAALNKFMKMAAIELGKAGIFVSLLHPGWVQTDMGGTAADITAQESAAGIIQCTERLNAETNGQFLKWDGEVHPW
ncbi:MAG: NAD(P)-dependent dehydrogenase (short-subunit alcohol dehydrogenase family) [Candidatus Azotimanducaceae bacterium]|jgi:NAD(P)-dependent dehydrogenase (short-subunit alcohol dehydrogenase family)